MSTYMSYEMAGIKEEFADWVSNISPEYTPFISMIKKIPVKNTHFQWQTDELAAVDINNANLEGSAAVSKTLKETTVQSSYTQIMRKVVMVSDTANAVSSHGREKELFYQLKKAASELKRDNETIFLLPAQVGVGHSAAGKALTTSLGQQIDPTMKKEAVDEVDFEKELFALTAIGFIAGSEANIIMYNPSLAGLFAGLQEIGNRKRIFENDKRFVKQVEYLVDPLGQGYKLIPNRFVPVKTAYIFNTNDIGMAVLRAPKQEKLAKKGSSEKYMIEQEVGLRLNNPKAAMMLTIA